MKNSKDYSQKTGKLYRSLKRKCPKVPQLVYNELLEAFIYGVISENMKESAAQAAIKRFAGYFVDLNDLRVSRPEEIIEMLGEDTPVTRNISSILTRALKAIFDEHNNLSLESLNKLGKRQARQVLEKIEGSSRFVVDYCMLTFLQGHAIPLTKNMIEYLKNNQMVHPEADEQEIEGFLARQISASNAYEFYSLLRHESESGKVARKIKATQQTNITAESTENEKID